MFRNHMDTEHKTFSVPIAFAHCSEGFIKADCTDIRCRICDEPCASLDEAAVHLKKVHGKPVDISTQLGIQPFVFIPGTLKCALCDSKSYSLRNLSRHTQSHFLTLTCESCGKSFSNNSTLQVHIRTSHIKIKKYECFKCKSCFSTLEEKRNHLNASSKCRKYLCNVCGERFVSGFIKEMHMTNIHGIARKPHVCPECELVFTDKKLFVRHFKITHTDDNFVCSFCGQKFVSKKDFEDHKVTHTNEKPYSCTGCSKSFSRKKNLVQHMWIHSEYKRFECKLCNKKFNQRVSWKSHFKTNHPELTNFEQGYDSSIKDYLSSSK